MLFADDLDLARAVVLDLTLDLSGPGAQLLEDSPRSLPIHHTRRPSQCEACAWLVVVSLGRWVMEKGKYECPLADRRLANDEDDICWDQERRRYRIKGA